LKHLINDWRGSAQYEDAEIEQLIRGYTEVGSGGHTRGHKESQLKELMNRFIVGSLLSDEELIRVYEATLNQQNVSDPEMTQLIATVRKTSMKRVKELLKKERKSALSPRSLFELQASLTKFDMTSSATDKGVKKAIADRGRGGRVGPLGNIKRVKQLFLAASLNAPMSPAECAELDAIISVTPSNMNTGDPETDSAIAPHYNIVQSGADKRLRHLLELSRKGKLSAAEKSELSSLAASVDTNIADAVLGSILAEVRDTSPLGSVARMDYLLQAASANKLMPQEKAEFNELLASIPASQTIGHGPADRLFIKYSKTIASLGSLTRLKRLLQLQGQGTVLNTAEKAELAGSILKIGDRSTGDGELDVMIAASNSNSSAKLASKLGRGNTMLNLMLDPNASESSSSGPDKRSKGPLPFKPANKSSPAAQKMVVEAAAKAQQAFDKVDSLAEAKKAADAEANAVTQATEEQKMEARAIWSMLQPRLGLAIESAVSAPEKGIKIVGIVPSSSAAIAGLVTGDHIRSLNGIPVTSQQTFIMEQRKFQPGDDIHMTVVRGGADIDLIVRMGAMGYSLDQVVKIRALATENKENKVVKVIRNKAAFYKGTQTNFVKINFDSDGKVSESYMDSSAPSPSLDAPSAPSPTNIQLVDEMLKLSAESPRLLVKQNSLAVTGSANDALATPGSSQLVRSLLQSSMSVDDAMKMLLGPALPGLIATPSNKS
jgi:hypothetical protein